MQIIYTAEAAELWLAWRPLSTFIDGRPRTKGSLDHVGNGRMRENVRGSSQWRQSVRERLALDLGQGTGPLGPVRHWRPYTGPVTVTAQFLFGRPVTSAHWPTAISYGDLDKLARNVGDAITDAGVIADDSQIVGWTLTKLFAPPGGRTGCNLMISGVMTPAGPA
jgi:hypothetical protein